MTTDTPVRSETLTLKELATILNLTPHYTAQLAKADKLPIPAFKVGNQWRFSRHHIEGLLDGTYRRTKETGDDR